MNAEEARAVIQNRFNETGDIEEWWHQDNESEYQLLFTMLTESAHMEPADALSVLRIAFFAAADEYGD